MALIYLNNGATSLAAANWSDATGLVEDSTAVISDGSQTIASDLDQSAVTNGIDTLDILPGFTGRIGSASAGPLKLRATNGATNRVTYRAGGGVLYLQAAGSGGNTITTFWKSSPAAAYLLGGAFTNIVLGQGPLDISESATGTTLELKGGSSIVRYNASGYTTVNVHSGSHVLMRGSTTVNVYGGNLIIDASSGTFTTINVLNPDSNVRFLSSGTVTTLNNNGRVDLSGLKRSTTFTNTTYGPAYVVVDNPSFVVRTFAPTYTGALVVG